MTAGADEAREVEEVTDVAMELIHATPHVEASLAGGQTEGRARCSLDTGGGYLLVSDALRRSLGLRPGEKLPGDGGGLDTVTGVRWKLGGRELDTSGVPTAVATARFIDRTAADAFLPARVLARGFVNFDYPRRRFRLGELMPPRNAARIASPVSEPQGFPRIELEVAGERIGMLLDAGASHCMISDAVLQRWSDAHPDWPVVPLALGTANMGGGGDVDVGRRMLVVPELTIGGAVAVSNVSFVSRPRGTFEDYMSPLMTAPIVGALAGNLLEHLDITIDYANQMTHLAPLSIHISPRHLAPLTVAVSDGGFVVADVGASSEGNDRGDTLVAIDGQPTASRSFAAVVADLARPRPGTVSVTTRNATSGSTRTTELATIAG